MTIGFMMDVAVLVLLAATVFLAFRLSISLRNFKESRFEMEGLVNRLTANIEQAEIAIAGMQNAARTSGVELQKIINESKFLGDELKFMNEAGNNLAGRLEKLADRNREMVDKIEGAGGIGPTPIQYREPMQTPLNKSAPPKITVSQAATARSSDDMMLGGFSIHDRDYEDDEEEDELAFMEADEDYPMQSSPDLQSQAERELFEAIQNSKNKARKTTIGRA